MGIGDDVAIVGEDHTGAAGGAGAGLAGDGDHRGDVALIDLLQGQAGFAHIAGGSRGGCAQMHLGDLVVLMDLGIGGGFGDLLRRGLADLQGNGPGVGAAVHEAVEEPDAQDAQQTEQTEKENEDHQHCCTAAAAAFWRSGPARLIYPGYPGIVELVSVHKIDLGMIINLLRAW